MIIFRADGNRILGTGHVMRCLSIADAIRKEGGEACFVTADNNMKELIQNRGFNCIVLGTDYKNMMDEIPLLKKENDYKKSDTIVVDSYYATSEYFRAISTEKKVAYIDDMAEEVYPVDILINYNIFANEEEYREKYKDSEYKDPKYLMGVSYAPLRQEFLDASKRKVNPTAKDVLILTGGSDSYHIALNLARYIVSKESNINKDSNKLKYHLVIGAMSDDYQDLKKIEDDYSDLIEIHRNVTNMKELMAGCDLAMSAAGSTMYELCACGVPTITYVLADNQKKIEKGFFEAGIAYTLGDYRYEGDFFKIAIEKIHELAENYELRSNLSQKSKRAVDGRGAERLTREIIKGYRK
ncbi:MAG: UDP-2,4-diacetamido-2,4,6-trideoxy-beta-L-altropyranose hydrolase [Eubacterium sp.]|nr:UDP-2,4-diacetamido-2,4,6-trideoxy-beta-L-altropyranose hydrolase [Eubacterium sp.]